MVKALFEYEVALEDLYFLPTAQNFFTESAVNDVPIPTLFGE